LSAFVIVWDNALRSMPIGETNVPYP